MPDRADNETSVTAGPVNIDYTPPVITAGIAPAADPLSGLRALPVTVTFSCEDALSGVATCPPPAVITTAGLDQSVAVEAFDAAGNRGEATVGDIDAGIPALTLLTGNRSLDEGEFFGGDLASVAAAVLTGGVAYFDWGDGYLEEVPITSDGLANTSYAFADNGAYTVTVTVVPEFGDPLVDTFDVSVGNLPPAFQETAFDGVATPEGSAPAGSAIVGHSLVLDFTYGDPGTADTHTATVDWGDGGPAEDVAPVEAPLGPPSNGGMTGSVLADHVYAAIGDYHGQACVEDDEGAADCIDFTVSIQPEPVLPALDCAVVFGQPVPGDTLDLPLAADIVSSDVESVDIRWEDSQGTLPFDDRHSLTPVLSFPPDTTEEVNLAVSFNALVHYVGGGSASCTAYACGILDPVSLTVNACELWRPVTEVELPTLKPNVDAVVSISGGGERCSITDAQFIDPLNVSPPPSGKENFPLGALDFTLEQCDVGSTVTVQVAFSAPNHVGAWFKLLDGKWTRYPFTTVDNRTITFEVTDGGAGDSDGEANGTIVDPGGPVLPSAGTGRVRVKGVSVVREGQPQPVRHPGRPARR